MGTISKGSREEGIQAAVSIASLNGHIPRDNWETGELKCSFCRECLVHIKRIDPDEIAITFVVNKICGDHTWWAIEVEKENNQQLVEHLNQNYEGKWV